MANVLDRRSMLVAGLLLLAWGTVRADDWYVDCKAAAGGDGTSEQRAFQTIQQAIDCEDVDDNDTIIVLPGVYDQGGTEDADGLTNRVLVTKSVNIRSRDGRNSTFVVGRLTSEGNRLGPDAVRCFGVTKPNVEIKGFTIASGATHNGGDAPNTAAGGVYFYNTATGGYVVDCVVSNCYATRGGGIRNGAGVVRTLFVANVASGNGSALRDTAAYHCVFTHHATSPIYGTKDIVNCTFALNWLTSGTRGAIFDSNTGDNSHLYNTTVLGPCSPLTGTGKGHDCVFSSDVTCGIEPENSVTDATQYQLMAPAFLDFRPQSTGRLPAAGKADWLAKIPEKYRYTDFNGETVSADGNGRVAAGAVQRSGTPVTGRLEIKGAGVAMGGNNSVDNIRDYAYSDVFPTQYVVTANHAANEHVYGLLASTGRTRFPLPDGRYILMPPESTSTTYTFERKLASAAKYVDDDATNAQAAGTSADPYPTIQQAVDAFADGAYGVIYVAPGTYDKGETFAMGVSNRVYVTGGKCLRIVATGGADATFIDGAYHPNGTYGFGASAVRCVAIDNCPTVVQGFTLRKGRTVENSGKEAGSAGAFFGTQNANSTAQLLDCVVTDCKGSRGVAGGGYIARCRFSDCEATGNGFTRWAQVASCLFYGNQAAGAFFTDDGAFYHNTVIGPSSSVAFSVNNLLYMNNIFVDFATGKAGATFVGNVAWNVTTLAPTSGFTVADPQFASPSDRNYRLLYGSPALTAGAASGSSLYALYATADLDGGILRLNGGVPAAGCHQTPVRSYAAVASGARLDSAGISPCGTNVFDVGDSVTFTATDTATRDLIGFEVDGVTQQVSGVTYTHTFTAEKGRVTVRALYRHDWYVAPDGNDAATGHDWDHPKQSLVQAMLVSGLQAGDTIHAAPGLYDRETATHATSVVGGSTSLGASRVVVPAGVTLVSRDGAATTFIRGAKTGKVTASDLSNAAIRGVFLEANARLVGFTVCGGATASSNKDDGLGGGVLCRNVTAQIVDCVISNNVASRGGAGFQGTYIRSRIVDNVGTVNGIALRGGDAPNLVIDGCLIDRNVGGNSSDLFYHFTKIVASTIGPDNVAPAGFGESENAPIVSSLLLHPAVAEQTKPLALTRCAFPETIVWPAGTTSNDCVTAAASAFALDANGAPVLGVHAAIDRALADDWDFAAWGKTDLNGVPRVMNGAMDIGACEADWRGRYAADLGLGRGARVTEVSSEVRENAEGKVFLPSGSLTVLLERRQATKLFCQYGCRVTGTGVLTVTVGDDVTTYTAADGAKTVSWKTQDDTVRLTFAYASGSEDAGGAVLENFRCVRSGFQLVIR